MKNIFNLSSKTRLLLENFFVYGIGQIIYKIIPIIMLPIIIRIMPDSSVYLGYNDLATTLISLVSIVGLMGMYDAIFRLLFDEEAKSEEKKREICSTGLWITGAFSLLCMLFIIIFGVKIELLWFNRSFGGYFSLICGTSIVGTNIANIVCTPTRARNNRIQYITGNSGASVAAYLVSMVMIHNGLYMFAMPLGALLSQLFSIMYFGLCNKNYFSLHSINTEYIKPLLKIGAPLMPAFLVFWVYNSFDRMMILKLLGVEANGQFAVAGKLAQVSQLIAAAFTAGWSYFNYKTMKDDKHTQDFSNIISLIIKTGLCAFVIFRITGDKIIELVFTSQYKGLGDVFSYLFLIPIVSIVYQLFGSQFVIIKKTAYTSCIAGMGIILNILMNYYFILHSGIVGAAIATVISYVVIIIIAMLVLSQKDMFIIDKWEILGAVLCLIIMIFDLNSYDGGLIYVLLIALLFVEIIFAIQKLKHVFLRGEL